MEKLHQNGGADALRRVHARVLLLVPQRVLLEVLPQHLARTRRFEFVGGAETVEEACRMAKSVRPDVVAVDLARGEQILREYLSKMGTAASACRFVLFNAKAEHTSVRWALQAGVSGYLASDASVAELAAALEQVLAGALYFSASIASLIQTEYVERAHGSGGPCANVLSARERVVVRERSQGRRVKEIASDLGLSPRTVEKHLENSSRKGVWGV